MTSLKKANRCCWWVRPGVGKTTLLREAARVLADDLGKRVIIVDTSNEIGGDGDIPHPGIGRARRMQVPSPYKQHAVMIEAVENHMPEVIVIDEIGTEAEAAAARTIAERGVQLIATAHGRTLENLLQNPTLMDLVGGIQAVTLSDEEARRRRTKKTVLERKAPPTFNVMIEIQERGRLAVYDNVAEVVDRFLRGIPLSPEIRTRVEGGRVEVSRPELPRREKNGGRCRKTGPETGEQTAEAEKYQDILLWGEPDKARTCNAETSVACGNHFGDRQGRSHRFPEIAGKAATGEYSGSRSQGNAQICSQEQHHDPDGEFPALAFPSEDVINVDEEAGIKEAQEAVEAVREHGRTVELSPRNSRVRRLQHILAEQSGLRSESIGRDPDRRVIVYPEQSYSQEYVIRLRYFGIRIQAGPAGLFSSFSVRAQKVQDICGIQGRSLFPSGPVFRSP